MGEKIKYVCSFCGKKNVKLWRPYNCCNPLICASCAEERQNPRKYNELTWDKTPDGYIGKPTRRKLPMGKWVVNEKGQIPSWVHGLGPNGKPYVFTDQLDVEGYGSMMPAVPDKDGSFWEYTFVPEERAKWWEDLPTH